MSHFTVLVIGADVEEQLAPYDERRTVSPYREELSAEELERMRNFYTKTWRCPKCDETGRGDITKCKACGYGYPAYNRPPKGDDKEKEKVIIEDGVPPSLEMLVQFMDDWHGSKGEVEDGKLYCWSTYNPDSKWDWYQTGGRWSGFFKMKPGKEGELGESGVFKNEPTYDADIAAKGDIDFEAMAVENAKQAAGWWDKCWEEFPASDDPEVEKKRSGNRDFMWGLKEGMTQEEFIKSHAVFSPYAIVKDGRWYQHGEMGFWGISINEMPRKEWDAKVMELIANLPDDTLMTILDCHI